jgi:hypothetical protein
MRLVRAEAHAGLRRYEDASREARAAADQGLRSGRLGALHLLLALRSGASPDASLVADCACANPIAFLTVLATPGEIRDGVPSESVRKALEPVVLDLRARRHPNASVAEQAVRLVLGTPGPAVPSAEGDPVRTDYLQTLGALAKVLSGEQGVPLGGTTTEAGRRFAAQRSPVPVASEIRRILRLLPE